MILEGCAHDTSTPAKLPHVTFSDQIIIVENGASGDCNYKTRLEYKSEQNYSESVMLVPRLVPVKYRSTIVFDTCQLLLPADESLENQIIDQQLIAENEENYKSSVTFYEDIYLLPKMTVKHFGSTVFQYPKETKTTFRTVFKFQFNSKNKVYVNGLTYPGIIDLGSDSYQFDDKLHSFNGQLNSASQNGASNGDGPISQSYISTKDLTIIKGIAVTCL